MKRLLLLFLLCFGLALPGVAADGTSFNPTTISVKSVGASIPVGTVITWPSNSWPSDRDNWLECNGQSISSAVYPELVALVGSRVPDYRGIFLRGHGSQTSTHYGTVAHTSAGLGQLQGDAIREMKGEAVMAGGTGNGLYSGVLNSVPYDTEIAWLTTSGKTQVQFRQLQFVASKALPVANENRPVNRAVRYLIRAR